jgi:hypothetical protein
MRDEARSTAAVTLTIMIYKADVPHWYRSNDVMDKIRVSESGSPKAVSGLWRMILK